MRRRIEMGMLRTLDLARASLTSFLISASLQQIAVCLLYLADEDDNLGRCSAFT